MGGRNVYRRGPEWGGRGRPVTVRGGPRVPAGSGWTVGSDSASLTPSLRDGRLWARRRVARCVQERKLAVRSQPLEASCFRFFLFLADHLQISLIPLSSSSPKSARPHASKQSPQLQKSPISRSALAHFSPARPPLSPSLSRPYPPRRRHDHIHHMASHTKKELSTSPPPREAAHSDESSKVKRK